ncbi:MAG: ATP-binding cassette domain-containing protein [Lachnospira sp.]|nr:ATP-binding cassette domain-containing protein [Lachnospira sp.]
MIELKNISKTFVTKEATVHAVKNATLSIAEGEIYGVIGYSGAGKSTLVRCINLLEVPESGTLSIDGFGTVTMQPGKKKPDFEPADGSGKRALTEKDLQRLRKGIGMIFQHFNLLDRSTVFDNVAFPLKKSGKSKEEIRSKVAELLNLVGLTEKANSYPSELSGGQKQRVAIARALANDPKILLSDEATRALDPDVTESILKLLKELNRKLGLTIVLITHEMAVIKEICNEVAVMENGEIVETGHVYDVFNLPTSDIATSFVESSSGLKRIDKLFAGRSPLVQKTEPGDVLVRLVFAGPSADEALITETAKETGCRVNIVLANIDLLEEKPLGSMIVMIKGTKEQTAAAVKKLKDSGVRVEEVVDDDVRKEEEQ